MEIRNTAPFPGKVTDAQLQALQLTQLAHTTQQGGVLRLKAARQVPQPGGGDTQQQGHEAHTRLRGPVRVTQEEALDGWGKGLVEEQLRCRDGLTCLPFLKASRAFSAVWIGIFSEYPLLC